MFFNSLCYNKHKIQYFHIFPSTLRSAFFCCLNFLSF
nr:MAG TPA: hypothetical protein [Caudoviricetes sp.]